MEQHLIECSRDTLKHDLKEIMHQIPVEPLTAPPKIVHPFSVKRPPPLQAPQAIKQSWQLL